MQVEALGIAFWSPDLKIIKYLLVNVKHAVHVRWLRNVLELQMLCKEVLVENTKISVGSLLVVNPGTEGVQAFAHATITIFNH